MFGDVDADRAMTLSFDPGATHTWLLTPVVAPGPVLPPNFIPLAASRRLDVFVGLVVDPSTGIKGLRVLR